MELFYSDNISAGQVLLDQEQSTHCVRVLRHREGDVISVIDGLGSLFECRLVDANPKAAVATVVSETPDFGAHPYHLTMAVCPTKNIDRFEWFAEKATEIGVDVIAPVFGDRSERRVLKTDRIRRLAVSATKQSLKGRVPEVREPVSVAEFVASAPESSLKLICYCEDDESRRVSVQEALAASDAREVMVLIGPEGDFSPEEIAAALSSGWKPVHLGSSRLRTETAAVVAATAVYLRLG